MPEAGQEYEIIRHENTRYRIFAVRILSRAPHVHGDFELGLVLEGETLFECAGKTETMKKGDVYLINPFERHSFSCRQQVTILSLQVSSSFFSGDYPSMGKIRFDQEGRIANTEVRMHIQEKMIKTAREYLEKRQWYELSVSYRIRELFHFLLESVPSHRMTEEEEDSGSRRAKRMMELTDFIESHYQEKLLLTSLAEKMGLNLYYLSHFFKDAFGVSFQTYVGKVRCEHARQLLAATDLSLLEISIACGFSDPKYFNRTFLEESGVLPREYREKNRMTVPKENGQAEGTIQELLDDEMAMKMICYLCK